MLLSFLLLFGVGGRSCSNFETSTLIPPGRRQFFPLLDYWVGRGLLHLFIALQMEGTAAKYIHAACLQKGPKWLEWRCCSMQLSLFPSLFNFRLCRGLGRTEYLLFLSLQDHRRQSTRKVWYFAHAELPFREKWSASLRCFNSPR